MLADVGLIVSGAALFPRTPTRLTLLHATNNTTGKRTAGFLRCLPIVMILTVEA